jgi:hypothetical protein
MAFFVVGVWAANLLTAVLLLAQRMPVDGHTPVASWLSYSNNAGTGEWPYESRFYVLG